MTTVLVTPARIVFLVLLVGTTLELLAERSRQAYRRSRWRKNLNGHVIICGYGTKGKSAVRTLVGKGVPRDRIVVLDHSRGRPRPGDSPGPGGGGGQRHLHGGLAEAGVQRGELRGGGRGP